MSITIHAQLHPQKPAAIHAVTGECITFSDLESRSRSLANALAQQGFGRGDALAVVMENDLRFFEIMWAALRSGLYFVSINRYSTPEEIAHIVNDSGAKAIIAAESVREAIVNLPRQAAQCGLCLALGQCPDGWQPYEAFVQQAAPQRDVEWAGEFLPYTSGTTGKPKGVFRELEDRTFETPWSFTEKIMSRHAIAEDCVYLCTAPLYHGQPQRFGCAVQGAGGTVVVMQKFDAEQALELIARYRVTHSQWVPTMFVRLLRLPEAARRGADLSSHRVAIHSAAPCPKDVKRQMIEWWGPILEETYGATDAGGDTLITSDEWLEHPGSVGRAKPSVIVCDESGNELPPGEEGLIYFKMRSPFVYLHDPEKTAQARHPTLPGYTAPGDIGLVDMAGYLFITDRISNMINSGGVNIYPQAVEDVLAGHPLVADCAVIGVPDEEMGEQVKAVVQLAAGTAPTEALKDELIDYLRQRVARHTVPKSLDFTDTLPRTPTGKLLKRLLRDGHGHPAPSPAGLE